MKKNDSHKCSRLLTLSGSLFCLSGVLTALCGWLPIAGIYLAGASCSFFAAYNSRIKENKKELEEKEYGKETL